MPENAHKCKTCAIIGTDCPACRHYSMYLPRPAPPQEERTCLTCGHVAAGQFCDGCLAVKGGGGPERINWLPRPAQPQEDRSCATCGCSRPGNGWYRVWCAWWGKAIPLGHGEPCEDWKPMAERTCATCVHSLGAVCVMGGIETNPCGGATEPTFEGRPSLWRPRAGVQSVAPVESPPAFLTPEGPCAVDKSWRIATSAVFVAPKFSPDLYGMSMIDLLQRSYGEGNVKERAVTVATWAVEVVRVKEGKVVEYLLDPQWLKGHHTESGAKNAAFKLACLAHPEAEMGDGVEVHARPF